MRVVKRLWADEELRSMNQVTTILRRMRTSATENPKSIIGFIRKLRVENSNENILSPQETISRAERLGIIAGNFYATKISNVSDGKREFEELRDTLSENWKKYNLYPESTYAKTRYDQSSSSFLSCMRTLHIDPKYYLDWEFTKANYFGRDTLEEVLDSNMGIFSPLSGDYFLCCTLLKYVEIRFDSKLKVKPIILSQDLKKYVLPTNPQGNLPFLDSDSIGVYLDVSETGNTSNTTYQILIRDYPGHTIHKPVSELVTFDQNDRIRRYYQELEAMS